MTILNLMLGKERGGLEQAALDYAQGMALANIPSLSVISPNAWVEAPMVAAGVAHETLINTGRFDFFAPTRLRTLAARTNATAIICHGNRALMLALRAFNTPSSPKIIAVAHNYKTKRFAKAHAAFAITQHLAQHLEAIGAKNITHMPNMVRVIDAPMREGFRTPPVIGTMGRFVAKKGFKHFIEALSVLRARGVDFKAFIGGDGEEASAIAELITRYQLEQHITLSGWVQNKPSFFAGLDLFVLPSLHEPFGIVLIEAMNHAVPVISTDSEGPREILHHGVDGILTPRGDPEKLADAIAELLANPARAAALGTAGNALVSKEYSMAAMAKRLQTALSPYMNAS
ncbi:MAG: glycosyltransferase family 4 protein [Rickettsiales bacterium]|nr:glycosyltransferase family 4 protein [Rickettsiales bacterium]